MKIAYVMSRFPKITETFVLYEMVALMKRDVDVEIYPLMREHTTVMHPEAIPLVEKAKFTPHISFPILLSNLRSIVKQPKTYFRTLFTALRATWGSRRYFTGVIAFFAKSIYMADLMESDGITHIHAHFASFPTASAYIINQMTNIPYSFTAHGSDLHRDKHMLCEKIDSAKFVVAISQYNREAMLEYCNKNNADKVRILHCGVDIDSFRPLDNTDTEKPITLVCTGTLHEVKGQTYLIQACKNLKEMGIHFECHFLGDGPDEAMLQAQVTEFDLENEIIFHGRVPRSEVIETLSQADIVVTPSVPTSDGRREGIPVALMEAMAFAVPVVASDLSGIPELVKHNVSGILVPPRNVEAITNALLELAQNNQMRQKFGRNGRERIINDFNLHENARTLSDLFEETIS